MAMAILPETGNAEASKECDTWFRNIAIATAKRILTFYRSQKLRICFAVAIAVFSTNGSA